MENQASSKSIILNYGLYYGLVSIFLSLILYALDMLLDQGFGIMAIGFLIMIAFIVLGIKKYKSVNNGFISWGQSVKIGVGLVALGALIGAIYQQIFINFIEPDFMAQTMERSSQALMDAGLTQDQIDAQMELSKSFQGPFISSALTIVIASFVGFIFTAIVGAIMKKTPEDQY